VLTIASKSAPFGFSENWITRPELSNFTKPYSDARLPKKKQDAVQLQNEEILISSGIWDTETIANTSLQQVHMIG
jgi:hypothetical protein